MNGRKRGWLVLVALVMSMSTLGMSAATASPWVPGGDRVGVTAPRPPYDTGVGDPIARTLFANPDRTVACRRVAGDAAWLECLLVRSDEIVRFGMAGGTVERVPCKAPFGDETCLLSFGRITIAPATATSKARFAGARAVPLERLVELGRRTMPYPVCIADPNLGLSCSTAMDDSVGQQIYIGISDSIWNCPGYEYVDGESGIPKGNNRCAVVRP